VPLVAESQFDNEDQWCASKGLAKRGSAIDHGVEIEPYLPTRSTAVKVTIGESTVRQGQEQTWRSSGFPASSVIKVSIRFDGNSLFLGPDPVADRDGTVHGTFSVGTNIRAGAVTLRVESSSDPTLYGEAEFTVESTGGRMTLRYSSARFRMESDVAYDISWFFEHVESVYEQLKVKLGHEPSQYLPIKFAIKQGPPGGTGGWTLSGEMGVEAQSFSKNRWCLVIPAQELVNLFTGSISGGWPLDWWADHKSPFPIMVAVEVVRDLGYVREADDYDTEFREDPLYVWHRNVKTAHGWQLYRNMFSAMKADGVRWDRLGSNPGKTLTNYVLAYMRIGAGALRLPSVEGIVPNADPRLIETIFKVRQEMQRIPRSDQRWVQYLEGANVESR
jgi:hypothetical protein